MDRFGQESKEVRATLMYGANNPVDGAVLEVILRKAEKIRAELGVPVPLPDEGHTLTQALLRAVLVRRPDSSVQMAFDFGESEAAQAVEATWRDAAERAKRNRTVFAQRRLKPEDVLPEWHKTLAAVGGNEDTRRFTDRALARLGSGLERLKRGYKAPLDHLPGDLRERLEAEGLAGTIRLDFVYPPAPRCRSVQRSHPLVSVLAETLLERSLGAEGSAGETGVLGRIGVWSAATVTARTVVALLRLRHQLTTSRAGRSTTLLVEEAAALAWVGAVTPEITEGEAALQTLALPPVADVPPHVRTRFVSQALQVLETQAADLDAYAEKRAQTLLADHRRVREAADARGSYSVQALLPVDVIGLFVILPAS